MFGNKTRVVLGNLLVLTVGLLGVEILFGNWFSSNRLNQLNLVTDVEYIYDVRNLYPTNDRQIVYKRDRYGLRGSYGRPDDIEILTVGGSTTDQRYISDGATWQDVLQREFSSHGVSLSIANAGIDGQSTYGHIKNFDWWFPYIPNLKVKYFLFYIGVNDFYNDADNEFDDLIKGPTTDISLRQQIKEKSALYYLYRTVRGIHRAQRGGVGHKPMNFKAIEWVDTPKANNHEELMRARLQAYRDRLHILNERVRKFGATPIYVTQPTSKCKERNGKIIGAAETETYGRVDVNGVDLCIMKRLLNKKTMEVCRETGGICIDLASDVVFDDSDFYDYSHNTPKGAEKIGHYLYEKLRPISNNFQ
jgi:hypothetical protein